MLADAFRTVSLRMRAQNSFTVAGCGQQSPEILRHVEISFIKRELA